MWPTGSATSADSVDRAPTSRTANGPALQSSPTSCPRSMLPPTALTGEPPVIGAGRRRHPWLLTRDARITARPSQTWSTPIARYSSSRTTVSVSARKAPQSGHFQYSFGSDHHSSLSRSGLKRMAAVSEPQCWHEPSGAGTGSMWCVGTSCDTLRIVVWRAARVALDRPEDPAVALGFEPGPLAACVTPALPGGPFEPPQRQCRSTKTLQ
jgi:hypothetical protein